MREETFDKNSLSETVRSSTEIVGKARRRQFSTSYIDRILKELDDAPYGEAGKILRREGLYSKQVATWRKHRTNGTVSKRGRKSATNDDARQKIGRLERANARLQHKLMQAEKIIEVQNKFRSYWE